MLNRTCTNFILVFLFIPFLTYSQITYQGPVTSSVDSGAIVNTDLFVDSPTSGESNPIIRGEMNSQQLGFEPMILESNGAEIFPTTYIEDQNVEDNANLVGDNSMLLAKWDVQLDNNVIPPDPTMAVGPNHVMVLTNNGVGIRIYDKQGTLLKSISSDSWWSAVWPSQSGDPQIIYDHYANRWVMVFMQVDDIAFKAGDLIAYSDDSDPFGTWYMYRLPSTLWGDFPQIGFDEEAIYIATNNFTFTGDGQYAKIRIISKAELYSSNAGLLTFKDIWNISIPGTASGVFNLRPSFHYSPAGGHYFLYASRNGTNYYALYKLVNPTTSPVLTGVKINVTFYGGSPNANQLGGSNPLIETGGSAIRNAPIFRDGFLYATHSIRNSVYTSYSSIKYFKIDVGTNSVVESAELGANGYYYFYPAIVVDKDGNVIINCSRSATTEYIGAYYTTKRASDPQGLSNTKTLQEGLGNYVKTFGGTNPRNRWGDYMGAFLDPEDEYSAWTFTEYASTGNNYATVVGQVRLKPFPGIFVFQNTELIDFKTNEIGFVSDTLDFVLSNYGDSALVINSIPNSSDDFNLVSDLSFPLTLNSFDSLTLKFCFTPTSFGEQIVNYPINNNSSTFTGIDLKGFGYEMNTAVGGKLFALSGTQNSGQTVNINKSTGVGTNIGNSNYSDFTGMAVNPKTNQLFGVRTNTLNSALYRVNAENGDAYYFKDVDLANIFSIAFDSSGTLYATNSANQIFLVDSISGATSLVSTMQASRVSVTFNPINNQLWGSVRNPIGSPKDRIIKIDILTGDTTRIGQTGFGTNTTALTFNELGQLYGIKGTGTTLSDVFTIDTTNAVGTLIGSTGIPDLQAIGYSLANITSVENIKTELPLDFTLDQNFPNPFNPSTQIRFGLPMSANVKITIYNLLGEVVKQLINQDMNAGAHSVQWNSDDVSGAKVSSGIYFYELNANGNNGDQFKQIRKMILLK